MIREPGSQPLSGSLNPTDRWNAMAVAVAVLVLAAAGFLWLVLRSAGAL